eukprot:gene2316-2537_t
MPRVILLLATILGVLTFPSLAVSERWSLEKAQAWHRSHAYKAGVNFVPSNAVNELEMFQAETYDPTTIDRELAFAQKIGFNTLRVFLHNILWEEGADAFLRRLDDFLSLADQRGFSTLLVLLDSCWNAYPKAGQQPDPIPGVHNSQWVQCPGHDLLQNNTAFDLAVKPYVQGVLTHFKDDKRVLAWDLWNEPDNSGYADDLIAPLLQRVFAWAREVHPSQPLTTPIWHSLPVEKLRYTDFQKLQLNLSDVLSFHNYETAEKLSEAIDHLQRFAPGRPAICTEYMARTAGSTFEPNLEILKEAGIFAYNWGLVSGKTQTIYPWSTTVIPAKQEPEIWFHDVLHADGTAFNQSEISYIQQVLKK